MSSLFVLLFGYKIIVKSLQKYSHYDRLILRIEEVAVDMHTEVFNNIDTLIEMAGASLKNMDEVNAELITLKRQIRNNTFKIFYFIIFISNLPF